MIEGLLVRSSPPAGSLCCVLKQDYFPLLSTGLTKKKTGNRPDISEKLLTGRKA